MTSKEKKKLKKKQKKENRSKFNKTVRNIVKIFLIIVATIVAFLIVKYSLILIGYRNDAKDIVSASTPDTFKAAQTSLVYDTNGLLITDMSGEKDVYYLEVGDIPYLVKRAVITVEDRKFYSHHGVDFKAVTRALWALIENSGDVTQGGSTITQQLAKNVFLTQEVTMTRKLKEVFIAKELEKKYTKEEILEYYINNIYFGNGYYGIEAAAQGYFSKTAAALSLSEIAYLCAIPNNPDTYDPFTNSENTLDRRDRILKQMYEEGDIDMELYKEALAETITLNPHHDTAKNNYVETYMRYCATIELMKLSGFTLRNKFENSEDEDDYYQQYNELYSEYSAKLYNGGYRIYTSIDLNVQNQLQISLDERLSQNTETNDEGIYALQGSATCIDNSNGYVVAIVGGRSQDYPGYTLNRAYQSYRQPGSSIKPILIYTPCFERGYTPNTIVTDERFSGGPQNSNGVYSGNITVRQAVIYSKNTVAWKLFDMLGTDTGINYLLNMDFSRIVKSDYVPAMSLGGMTYGVSALEMASAYSTIENDGVFRTPTCIIKITDAQGNIIVDNTVDEKIIYEENATRMMTNVLKGVLTDGTGKAYNISNAICAGKTGTTDDNKDSWFIGYSHYYTTSVWVGYDLPRTIEDDYTRTSAGLIWNNFMIKMHIGRDLVEFTGYVSDDETETTTSSHTTTDTQTPTQDNIIYHGGDSGASGSSDSGVYNGNDSGGSAAPEPGMYHYN